VEVLDGKAHTGKSPTKLARLKAKKKLVRPAGISTGPVAIVTWSLGPGGMIGIAGPMGIESPSRSTTQLWSVRSLRIAPPAGGFL
jgi:hypothetical protein